MTINISIPDVEQNLHPVITVLGVGGSGGNAVNNMMNSNLEGVDFLIANTDAQALQVSTCKNKIQLGVVSTKGLGAGMRPDVGKQAAEEAIDEISEKLNGSHMLFIAAGMGGGTGTGAAPVIAKLAREKGILTVGVATKPFHFEGSQRMKLAEKGIDELQQYTKYVGGYSSLSPAVRILWDVLRSFNQQDRQKFLHFVTSCERAPPLGFSQLEPKFTIQWVPNPTGEKLPSASTCFNILKFSVIIFFYIFKLAVNKILFFFYSF